MRLDCATRLAMLLAAMTLCALINIPAVVSQENGAEESHPITELPAPPEADAERLTRIIRAVRARPIAAQPFPDSGQPGGGALLTADRRMIQRLKKAGELIEQQQYADAASLLQVILDAAEDHFFRPDAKQKSQFRSLKAEAQRLIGGMPADGVRAYELQQGATARAMLADALAADDIARVTEVSRRFFFTDAGRQAAYHVGSVHFDRAQPLAAALCFEQLLENPAAAAGWEPALSLKTALCWSRAGMPEKARAVLAALRKNLGDRGSVSIHGRDVALFAEEADAVEWLSRVFGAAGKGRLTGETGWAMFRGNAARNGTVAAGDAGHFDGWKSPVPTVYDVTRFPGDTAETENDRRLQKAVRDVAAALKQQQRTALPQGQPLVVGGTTYVRTIGNILAFDAGDGAKRWETFFDATIEGLLGSPEEHAGPSQPQFLQALVAQRVWGDATWGTMSSDGRFLYAVEDLGLATAIHRPLPKPAGGVPWEQPPRENTLVAYHLQDDGRVGQRAWTLGGAAGDPLLENPLAGTFFLGTPLPLGGQLYCLAEADGEIRLLVIDPGLAAQATRPRFDALVWSQPLAGAGLPIDQDAGRRQSGTSVSYADGVMVCPTDAGYVVAVDLTRRSLLWAYEYQRAENPPGLPIPRPRPGGPAPAGGTRWADTAAVIVDGKVLLTPRTGNDVVCLKLLDGSRIWQKTKADGLYLAGVVDGKVLLVGASTVEALSLKDGSAAWKKAIPLAAPSGRGFVRDGGLYLPLSMGEIAVVDVAIGSVVATMKVPGDAVPGNLVAVGDAVISQGIDRVDVFPLPATK